MAVGWCLKKELYLPPTLLIGVDVVVGVGKYFYSKKSKVGIYMVFQNRVYFPVRNINGTITLI